MVSFIVCLLLHLSFFHSVSGLKEKMLHSFIHWCSIFFTIIQTFKVENNLEKKHFFCLFFSLSSLFYVYIPNLESENRQKCSKRKYESTKWQVGQKVVGMRKCAHGRHAHLHTPTTCWRCTSSECEILTLWRCAHLRTWTIVVGSHICMHWSFIFCASGLCNHLPP